MKFITALQNTLHGWFAQEKPAIRWLFGLMSIVSLPYVPLFCLQEAGNGLHSATNVSFFSTLLSLYLIIGSFLLLGFLLMGLPLAFFLTSKRLLLLWYCLVFMPYVLFLPDNLFFRTLIFAIYFGPTFFPSQ